LNTIIIFRVIFAATLFALVTGPVSFWLARKTGLMDIPGSAPHKMHDATRPVAGGVALFITVFVIGFFTGAFQFPSVRPILLASIIIFLFGLLDDFRDISPFWKLVGQLAASLCLIGLGIQIHLFQENWLNIGLTLLWLLGVTNAYNFVDSTDGLAVGLAGIAAAFYMLVAVDSHQNDLSLFSAILLGACFGIFYYNSSPAYFFLGDSGSQWLGFVLAGIGIAYNPLGFSRLSSWYIPILLAGVPLFDAALVVISRLRRGKPIYEAALDHTFHRLTMYGMSPNRAVLTMHGVSLLFGCMAFVALYLPPIIANAFFGAASLAGIGTLVFLDDKRRWL
jgi:UDP-GlcNAc:undecaprenyl-phosphate GlcNAc-1-phosphate transferase